MSDPNKNQQVVQKKVVGLRDNTNFYDGYAFGFKQPVLRYGLVVRKEHSPDLNELACLLGSELGIDRQELQEHDEYKTMVSFLTRFTRIILETSSHPVFQDARITRLSKSNPDTWIVFQPCFHHAAALQVVSFLLHLINEHCSGRSSEQVNNMKARLDTLVKNVKEKGTQGFNSIHFLSAASELSIPWYVLGNGVFQLGQGKEARLINSSYTDATPVIAAKIARNKVYAAYLLHIGGLPVPSHQLAMNEQDAVAIAEKLGYPVVVKPGNLDGGVGVRAYLRNDAAVRKAFVFAKKHSRHILVEKHVDGHDYRILVVNGQVLGALERIPGGVTANGQDTLRVLLERQNHERQNARDDRRYLHQIRPDEQTEDLLEAQELDWLSVPEKGRFVRLCGTANVASGGVPVPLKPDQIHPDNVDLVLRAARLLRLDVAGIDLLMPDIGTSWLTSGAYICEVNAQPQMHTSMHKPMLMSMFDGSDGRIPVAFVLSGRSEGRKVADMIHRQLMEKGLKAGLVSGDQVWIGSTCVSRHCPGSFAGARMLCHDPDVEAMVICVGDTRILRHGWPVDSSHALVVDSCLPGDSPENPQQDSIRQWLSYASHLTPGLVCIDHGMFSGTADLVRKIFKDAKIVTSDGYEDHIAMKEIGEAICSVQPPS